MMKVSLIYSHTDSHWLSCQFITRNLLASYSTLFKQNGKIKTQVINFHKKLREFEIDQEAQKIVLFQPELIIFVDHTPHPHALINGLAKEYQAVRKSLQPTLIFHVFGDFPLMSAEWRRCEKALKRFRVKWLCASDAQADLLKKFIKNSNDTIDKIPFPVDGEKFYFQKSLGIRLREKLEIGKEDVVFLYTGRISYQKRLQELLSLFAKLSTSHPGRCKLFLAGPFDSLGNFYTGDHLYEGEYSQKLLSLLGQFPKQIRHSITYLGNVEEWALNEAYNAADIFVSLSTHNDEDYGMSPAEALLTGLPAVLTGWGGYNSFKKRQNEVCLIDVRINPSSPVIDLHFGQFLQETNRLILNIKELREQREERAAFNKNIWEIKVVSQILKNSVLKNEAFPFKGFTDKVSAFEEAFRKATPFIVKRPFYSSFYSELYESYISKKL